ncbi:MAG TPA: o-succinylbenzoate synthase [bacterium]|nr:o-succinylbenzoate synthase [bacterium]
MNIESVQVIPYRRALPRPITTAHGQYREREGIVLILRDESGRVGIGEAAPLAGVSTDTFAECAAALSGLMTAGRSRLDPAHWFSDFSHPIISMPPAARFAVACALGELKAKSVGLSLCRTLSGEETCARVPINGLLSGATVGETQTRATALAAAGYHVFKLKVGYDSPFDDVRRIIAACEAAPDVLLRLDANAGWTAAWAEDVLSRIPLERLDFIEQPFPRGQWEAAQALAHRFGIRLALDEEIQTIAEADHLIAQRACDVLVLKPMVIGHLYQCFVTARRAQQAGMQVIYTSSWESDIGVAATLHLAAALGPHPPAMGLSTAGMIADGILRTPLAIDSGYLAVPDGPGMGVEPVEELLAD